MAFGDNQVHRGLVDLVRFMGLTSVTPAGMALIKKNSNFKGEDNVPKLPSVTCLFNGATIWRLSSNHFLLM